MTGHKELVDRLRGFIAETDYGKGLLMSIDVADVEEAARVIEGQAGEIARLRKALEFYAVEDDWWEMKDNESAPDNYRYGSKLGSDYGETARKALTHPPETGS